MERCKRCGGELFPGATDCPRCGALVESKPVPLVEGEPGSAHSVWAGGYAVIAVLGLVNLYRAATGRSVWFFEMPHGVTLEEEPGWFCLVVILWLIVVPMLIYRAYKHLVLSKANTASWK